ncbi:unnamed protein product [Cylicostephanus goldi]|uniref:Uncharacterized protein n=1 Tax=Cylicostephanus goldi TaxID=71465 RepID=A0A3P7N6L4_CYLGO|nr:unnamed protein product [Cylicostephanus goldi]
MIVWVNTTVLMVGMLKAWVLLGQRRGRVTARPTIAKPSL